MDVEKPQRVPFQFFGIVRLFSEFFFSPKGPPFSFFDILQQNECLKIPDGPPFPFFEIFFSKGSPVQLRQKCRQFRKCSPLLARQGLALAGPGAPLSPFFWFFDFRVL